MKSWITFVLILFATGAQAQELRFPSNARLQAEVVHPARSYPVPLGPWVDGAFPVAMAEGRVSQWAWQVAPTSLTTLQLVRPLREQLRNAGYAIIFECETNACGGFDFRFALEVLPPPELQVNLGDFRHLTARRLGGDTPDIVTLLVSRSGEIGFVQVTHIGEVPQVIEIAPPPAAAQALPAETDGLIGQLETVGRAVLVDLSFPPGSAQLEDGRYDSLGDLARYLLDNPDIDVALVGHTDTSGTLEANITLSQRRAASVLERLVSAYGVGRSRLRAEGMGYLAPVATNQTEEGREQNRRVEALVTSIRPEN